ncbi:TlpA family protein disulfide reductase [Jannaschia helgolandensis]|uniref:Thiol-disulfide isomerase or thioredoxin n=1 Tax=Jannaschia helgolandensis TaxID=188906 RepID=A0A1H7LKT2_9RHOB|nr:TlpA disulfide reductase family protein [Jannaschia helgolandensis]SEK99506.1 Thiol-disulfide isomerase or thioredoxin [Jannaschia helgolandensis]
MKQTILAFAAWLFSAMAAAAVPQGFAIHDTPQIVPNVRFVTRDGSRMDLEDFQGRVVLLNIWATWCVPCREEMPTLDALQAELGGPGFEVLALSIDRAGAGVVQRFYDEIGISKLKMYVDTTMLSATALRAFGLPTTLLIDRNGREIGRLVGPAEWDDPEMIAFLRQYVK